MAKSNNRGGRNQNSERGMIDLARERPIAAAAAAAGAAAAGLFLWSKRTLISEQLGNLSDQIGEWTEGMRSGNSGEDFSAGDEPASESFIASPRRRTTRKSQSDIAEEAMTLKETGKAKA